MAETLGEAVRAAAEWVNPSISRSCPLSELAHGALKLAPGTAQGDQMRSLVQRFVLYSKAPPAMMHVNHLVSCCNIPTTDYVGDKHPSQSPGNLDLDKFIEFFTPQPIGNTSEAKEKRVLNLFEDWSDSSTECDEHDILRDALLEACERLGKQFGSLSPTPREFLMQRLATAAPMTIANSNVVNMCSNQDSLLDTTFTTVIENSLVKFEQSTDRSRIKLVEFIVAAINEGSLDFSTKMVLAERLIFCSMPHPEASAGSRVLLEGFCKAIDWVGRELELVDDTLAMEALVGAIDRLGAGIEVKELLKLVMRETLLIDWDVSDVIAVLESIGIKQNLFKGICIPASLDIKQKFKIRNDIPKDSSNSEILATEDQQNRNQRHKNRYCCFLFF